MSEASKVTTLDPDQRAIVDDRTTRLLLVEAPPGCGKTEMLAHRFISLAEQHARPDRILCVTFTLRARDAFEARIRALAPDWALRLRGEEADLLRRSRPDAPPRLWIGTFHDHARRIIEFHLDRLRGPLAPYREGIIVADQAQADAMLAAALRDRDLLPADEQSARRTLQRARSALAASKRCGLDPIRDRDPKRLLGTAPSLQRGWPEAFRAYEQTLIRSRLIDFDSLLMRARQLLLLPGPIGPAWSTRFDHVLVDEAQDLDRFQLDIATILAAKATLTFAGDDLQSIYRWRGSIGSFDHIASMAARSHQAPERRQLRYDYRLPPAIQQAANALRQRYKPGSTLPFASRLPEHGPPVHTETNTREEMFDRLERTIASLTAGASPQVPDDRPSTEADCLVLARTNAGAIDAARRLTATGRRARIEDRTDTDTRSLALVTVLRAVLAPPPDSLVKSVIAGWPWDVPVTLLDEPERRARTAGCALLHFLWRERIEPTLDLDPSIAAASAALLDLRERAEDRPDDPTGILESTLAVITARDAAECPRRDDGYHERLCSLLRSLASASRSTGPLSDYLEDATRDALDEHAVRCSTMHGAKGEEARHVLVVDWHDDRFAHDDDEHLEAGRLALVILTRARRTFHSFSHRWTARGAEQRPARFLAEAGIRIQYAADRPPRPADEGAAQ